MTDNFHFIFYLTIFLTGLVTVNSIKCYDCDSLREPRCNEYFSPEGVQVSDCEEAKMPEYLRKYGRRIEATGCLTKIHEGVEGFRFFIRRTCYFGNLENTKEACETPDPYLPYADILACNICEEDLCNTDRAGVIMPSFYTFMTISLCVVLLKMFF